MYGLPETGHGWQLMSTRPTKKIDSRRTYPLTSTALLIAIKSSATDGGLHMVNLKEMKFVEMPARDRDPVVAMPDKIVDRLREQAQLLENPDHVRVTRRWKGKGDDRREYEQRQKVRPYWKPL